jgi:hypothetical protein
MSGPVDQPRPAQCEAARPPIGVCELNRYQLLGENITDNVYHVALA